MPEKNGCQLARELINLKDSLKLNKMFHISLISNNNVVEKKEQIDKHFIQPLDLRELTKGSQFAILKSFRPVS